MKKILLGATEIITPQNGFGALPIQRVSHEDAVRLLKTAYSGGITFFDTARAYSNSEEKLGAAFSGMRNNIYIASKTMAKTPEKFWADLHTSLETLKTDYIDVYQFHCAEKSYAPDDGTGMYECMQEAKAQGKIRRIGITAHRVDIAEQAVASGFYETLQFPLSYLASEREENLVYRCRDKNMGFIAMKGMAGGLITNSQAAMAYMAQFDNVLPIWGVQRESELGQWLDYMRETPIMTKDICEFIASEREELKGNFCRGCGYCEPCPKGIMIHQCARMSLMLRRAPAQAWLRESMQQEMKKIELCEECGLCKSRCPYELDTPSLLKQNYIDYQKVLAGKTSI